MIMSICDSHDLFCDLSSINGLRRDHNRGLKSQAFDARTCYFKKLTLLVKKFSMPYLPQTDGVLVPSLQKGSRIQVSDQAMHDPSRQRCLKGHLFPKKAVIPIFLEMQLSIHRWEGQIASFTLIKSRLKK